MTSQNRIPRKHRRRHHARLLLCVSSGAMLVAGAGIAGASETKTYTYDALGRLVTVAHSGTVNNSQKASYCLDPAGNRTVYKSDSTGAAAVCPPTPTPT